MSMGQALAVIPGAINLRRHARMQHAACHSAGLRPMREQGIGCVGGGAVPRQDRRPESTPANQNLHLDACQCVKDRCSYKTDLVRDPILTTLTPTLTLKTLTLTLTLILTLTLTLSSIRPAGSWMRPGDATPPWRPACCRRPAT